MLQCFLCRESFVLVALHQSRNQIFALLGTFDPFFVWELVKSLLHLRKNFIVVFARKRWFTRKHNVQDDSNAPQVALFSVVASQHFWGYVVRRAVHLVHYVGFSIEDVGRAEVNHLDCTLVLWIDQNVLRFQISMSDSLLMAIRNCLQHLFCDDCGFHF